MPSSPRLSNSIEFFQTENPFKQLKEDHDEKKLEKDIGRNRKTKAQEKAVKELNSMVETVLKRYKETLFLKEAYTIEQCAKPDRWNLVKEAGNNRWPGIVVEVTLMCDDKGNPDHFAVAMGFPEPRTLCSPSRDDLICAIDRLHRTKYL